MLSASEIKGITGIKPEDFTSSPKYFDIPI
jgi:hypothetical protein